jgi:tetratricopeptide (TPR) repeat protein
VCTSNVIVHVEVEKYGMVVDPGCMKCMDCVSVCPNDALYFGFGKPAVAVKKKASRNYPLSWPEEIAAVVIYIASYLAVWDVYQLVPMLMALGIASITTYLAMRSWMLFRASDLAFLKYALKASGKITTAGWTFLLFSLLWCGLTVHSGWVRYHESAGSAAFERIQIPVELALARTEPLQWRSKGDRATAADGRRHLDLAISGGLFLNTDALAKRAWLEYLLGDNDAAIRSLAEAASDQTGQARALSLYYRGAILNRLGRYDMALADLNAALIERPDLASAREERGEALWQMGRADEAKAQWKDAAQNPNMVLANYMLAGSSYAAGDTSAAAAYENKAGSLTPDNASFHWMLGLRLENLKMNALAEKHFQRAIQLDPEFSARRDLELINRRQL